MKGDNIFPSDKNLVTFLLNKYYFQIGDSSPKIELSHPPTIVRGIEEKTGSL